MKLLSSTTIAITFMALAGVTTAVQAKVNSEQVERSGQTVSYADLNLANPAGREALHRRIELAAEVVCEVREARSARDIAESNDCAERAAARALDKVPQQRLITMN
jgi:UrcA family protein